MKYKVGDRVRCIVPAFIEMFAEHNIWVIHHIKTQVKNPSLYVAYREDDKNKMLYHFLESEVVYEEEI